MTYTSLEEHKTLLDDFAKISSSHSVLLIECGDLKNKTESMEKELNEKDNEISKLKNALAQSRNNARKYMLSRNHFSRKFKIKNDANKVLNSKLKGITKEKNKSKVFIFLTHRLKKY